MRRLRTPLTVLAFVLAAATLAARQVAPDDVYRVFLDDGQSLQSYGQAVVVGDQLVFTLVIGDVAHGSTSQQLMSLPLASVDLPRTQRYAEAKQAARYAHTRGEADYAAVIAEVGRSLQQLAAIQDPARRLSLAEQARQRLVDWSRDHFHYRASDVAELAGLFDQVIAELGVAAGRSRFSLDLEANAGQTKTEPLLPTLGLRQSIALALSAADRTGDRQERLAILRAAARELEGAPGLDDLRREIAVTLDAERTIDLAYAALERDARARLDDPRTLVSVSALRALASEVAARDHAFGSKRPQLIAALDAKIADALGAAEEYEAALARYRADRPALARYRTRVAGVTDGFGRLAPLLSAIRDGRRSEYASLDRAVPTLDGLRSKLRKVSPPSAADQAHASFDSALLLARQACELGKQAAITSNPTTTRAASTAAAGALMLFDHARDQLAAGLRPPTIR